LTANALLFRIIIQLPTASISFTLLHPTVSLTHTHTHTNTTTIKWSFEID